MDIPGRPRPLTFGVEFEFVVATLKLGAEDPTPNDTRPARFPTKSIPDYLGLCIEAQANHTDRDLSKFGGLAQTIADPLKLHGFPAFPWFRGPQCQFRASPRDLAGWEVKLDSSIYVAEDDDIPCRHKNYKYLGIEVTSPILQKWYDNPQNPAIDNADFGKISQVATILRTSFRAFTNKSCGLHVHVGHGAQGFTLEAARKLMAFLWSHEPGIEKLHPVDRRDINAPGSDEPGQDHIRFCWPIRSGREIRTQAQGNEMIDKILGAGSLEELQDILEPPPMVKSACLLNNLISAIPPTKKTIEFRQHEGTLDGYEAMVWAKFCVALVEYAEKTDGRMMYFKCRDAIYMEMWRYYGYYSLPEVCGIVGFPLGQVLWESVRTDDDADLPEGEDWDALTDGFGQAQ